MKFTIPGRLNGLNDYTTANRTNRFGGNTMKKKNEEIIFWAIRQAKLSKVTNYPISLEIMWYEPNMRRDFDNITFAVKFILDSMVNAKIIENDSLKFVNKIDHTVLIDRDNPRIEVEIKEVRN